MRAQLKMHLQRPRELRRRVMLRARLRAPSGWSDACILNVSSRGLLINANVGAAKGSTIELWHGEHFIVGTVVWRQGSRAGLQSNERLPVEEILALSKSAPFQLTAASWPIADRRQRRREGQDGRNLGRLIEFAGITASAIALAFGALSLVERALARPLVSIMQALG